MAKKLPPTVVKLRKALLKRRKELYEEIKTLKEQHYSEMYSKLSELLRIEKKINPKFTMRDLAGKVLLNEGYVYQIFSWRKATPSLKKMVKEEKIHMKKATRILARMRTSSPEKIDIVAKSVVKHKMSDEEIDKFISGRKIEERRMYKEREYKNEWNIVRDISMIKMRLLRILLSIKKVPKNHRKNVLSDMRRMKKALTVAVSLLEADSGKKNNH